MAKKGSKIILIQFILIFLAGFSLGVGTLWPGIIRENGRKCFFEIERKSSMRIRLGSVVVSIKN